MSLAIRFLGTGTAFADFRKNYHNNALVETDAGLLMIDCGATAVQSLKELDIPPWEIAAVLITHLHGDHVNGLEQLVWERTYTGPTGPAFLPTTVVAAPDVWPDVAAMLEPLLREWNDPRGQVRDDGLRALVQPVIWEPEASHAFGEVRLSLHRTPHVQGDGIDKAAYAVRFARRETAALYTSDTIFRPDIGERFPDARRIFHDCTFLPWFPQTVHTHYEQLLTLPAEVRARVVLMHYTEVPPGIDVRADGFVAAARKHERFVI